MRSLSTTVVSVLLAAVLGAQVPAPDFDLLVTLNSSTSLTLDFTVVGPPNSNYIVLGTFDNPDLTPFQQIGVFTLAQGVLPVNGLATHNFTVPSWQGPLPDVWFGALIVDAGVPYVPDIVSMGGAMFFALAPLPDLASVVTYNRGTGALDVDIKLPGGAGTQVTVWWSTNCPTLGQQPLPGTLHFVGAGWTGATGLADFGLNDPNIPAGACIVLTIVVGGLSTVVGVRHV